VVIFALLIQDPDPIRTGTSLPKTWSVKLAYVCSNLMRSYHAYFGTIRRGVCYFFIEIEGAAMDLHSGVFGGTVHEVQ
jgi:hypothetical protein